jgi:hypothetical protein
MELPDSGIVAGILLSVMLIRELVPLVRQQVERRRSERPPPIPPPRSEMPTPRFDMGAAADQSGAHGVVTLIPGEAPLDGLRREVDSLRKDNIQLGRELERALALVAGFAAKLEALSRDVGRLEGKLER